MKTITFEKAIEILENCSAVIWGEHFLSYPDVNSEEQEVYLKIDEDGVSYEVNFNKEKNESVSIQGGSLFLIDVLGEEVQLTVLVGQDLENC